MSNYKQNYSMLELALIYSTNGISILPCNACNKSPYIKGGLNSASCNELQIRQWWSRWPNAVVGLPCWANGIIVIDADRHGHGDGVCALDEIFAANGFDKTSVPNVFTPNNGVHYIFKRPRGMRPTIAQVAKNIDVRDNAYVIAAGSQMSNSSEYTLKLGVTVKMLADGISSSSFSELPNWMRRIIEKKEDFCHRQKSSRILNFEKQSNIQISRQLEGIVHAIVNSDLGTRNNYLYWASCRFGELIARQFIEKDLAEALLHEAGAQAGLSILEVLPTVKSGLMHGGG